MWNRFIITNILVFFASITFATTNQKIIEQANKLIKNKKYESAFKKLDQHDPQNKNLDIFLKKYEIVSKYAISSKQHRSYALKDFKKNNNNDLKYYPFDVDIIFDSLLKVQPNNCELYKLASEHLFDIHSKFGKNWLKPESDYLKQMAVYSEKAIKGNCADDKSYYKIGYYLIDAGKYQESIYFLYQSILKNDKNPTYHYNISLSYLMTRAPSSALKHAKLAYNLYNDSLYKSDASRLLAEAYFQNNFVDSAIMFFENAEELDSTTTNNISSLLNIYLKSSNAKADDYFTKLYNLDPTNPAIYNQLEQIYSKNAKEKELTKKYEDLLLKHKDNTEVLANLKYYLARLYSIENKELAISTYTESKSYFEKIFKNDHPVFKSIEESIQQLRDQK